jgi:hypothetical protein
MASALGTNTLIVSLGVCGLGSALAALAGVIAAPLLQADLSMRAAILVDLFVVIVIGGSGSLLGHPLHPHLLLGPEGGRGVAPPGPPGPAPRRSTKKAVILASRSGPSSP